MFHTVLTADLPSVERPGAAPGDDEFARTHDRVSYGSAHLLELLRAAFDAAGVRDIAFLRIDDDVVYEDPDATADDEVGQLMERAAQSGFLGRPFFRITMALSHHEEGVFHAVEVELRTAVPAGEPEMTVTVSSRPDWAFPEPNETTAAFAQRIRSQAGRSGPVAALARVQALRDRLLTSMRDAFAASTVAAGETTLRMVRPDLEHLEPIGRLGLGRGQPGMRFSLAPDGRPGLWEDVFLRQYEDPTLVLRNVMLLEAMMSDGHLRQPWVQVVDVTGRVLFDGTKARWFEDWPWRRRFELDAMPSGDLAFRRT
ncbi:MAG: hypothetical protein H6732_07520 [Alphaproteobacteria bacterium]|nr:hypothetical protein [Alphaproteobacteria bacterium]